MTRKKHIGIRTGGYLSLQFHVVLPRGDFLSEDLSASYSNSCAYHKIYNLQLFIEKSGGAISATWRDLHPSVGRYFMGGVTKWPSGQNFTPLESTGQAHLYLNSNKIRLSLWEERLL